MLRRTRLLFVGDSVAAGFRLAEAPAYPQLAAEHLRQRDLDVDVVVDALDGADSAYVLKRFSRMVTAHEPDVVVVELGLNDARPPLPRQVTPPAAYAANLVGLVDRILSLGAQPVLVTPNPRFDSAQQPRVAGDPATDCMLPYVEAVRGLARDLRLPLIDAYQAFLAEDDLPSLIPDGVHPSAAGHELFADVVAEELLGSGLCARRGRTADARR